MSGIIQVGGGISGHRGESKKGIMAITRPMEADFFWPEPVFALRLAANLTVSRSGRPDVRQKVTGNFVRCSELKR
jgi:hypothetical protein